MLRNSNRLTEPMLLPVIGTILLAAIWAMTFNLIHVERSVATRAAAASSVELVETYEAQVVRSLREIDQTLRLVKFAHERTGGRIDLSELRARSLLLPDLLFVTTIVDASGGVVASSFSPSAGSVDRQAPFEALRRGDPGVAVGRPERRSDGEWTLDFMRRIDSPNGRFAGAVVVTVPAAYFVSGYDGAKLGARGVLALLGNDGVFRVRRTGEVVTAGDAADFRRVVKPPPEGGGAPVVNGWDGVSRFVGARELFDFPFAVVVGLAEDEQLAAANESARRYLVGAVVASLLVALVLGGLAAMSWSAARFRRKAEAALNLRNRAIESSVNAIVITDLSRPELPIDYVNPAFERITGYKSAEVVGRSGAFLLGEDADQPAMQDLLLALREKREGHAILRNYRKDGSLFWNDFHMAPVRDDKGWVTHYVGVMNDVTAAKTYEDQLAHQANFDTLTGLANRNLLSDRLAQAIAGAHRNAGAVATVFIDLDNFKLVNDSLGHNQGDELLRTVAARLKACVRESDTVARLGGDEFVLVLLNKGDPATLEADVTAMVTKLLRQVAQPVRLGDRTLRPACSVGVSLYPQDGEDADTLLRNADAAMYRAKELGRNRFQFFTTDVHERIRRRMELESSLRHALDNDEFELHFQPQAELRTGRIVGCEALLRWRHPQKGLINPGQFIGFAEETGLIVPIGSWVLERACRQAKAWQDAGLPPISIGVNMSALQCGQPDVDLVVRRALEASGLAPKWLELEITESLSMANPEQSVPLMTRLKDTGVSLAIDDFGTGFSNLSYLRRFPIDRLKIDLSFTREMTTDASSLAIVEAIITMSHSLNLKVVAEGVENQAQLELLAARRCDAIQGHYFGMPVLPEAFARLLSEDHSLEDVRARRGEALHAHPTLQ